MNRVDLDVLKSSYRWLADGCRVLLVTVVGTWGSSPGPGGAMPAVRADGRVAGSVSGGCIEDDLIEQVRRNGIEQTRPQLAGYGVSAEKTRYVTASLVKASGSGWSTGNVSGARAARADA